MEKKFFKRLLSAFTLAAFVVTSVPSSYAQSVLTLPAPGTMVPLSQPFNPPVLKGIKVYPNDPFRFDFILDKGDSKQADTELKDESNRLIKYFLASLTVPEKDLWVNLSPYEKDRIVPEAFGQTEMGRDLLAQDYLLKQITASVIYPEGETGKKFWAEVYKKAQEKYGTTDIPVDTFNKVWIVPEKAVVYENAKAGTAYVVESRLKVMLESDYVALEHSVIKGTGNKVSGADKETQELAKNVIREIILPEIEKDVNEGKNFTALRQVYQSLILAAWFKKKIKESVLSQVYVDRNKVMGVNIDDPKEPEKIWTQYVEAFKKGVYSYIKDEYASFEQQVVPRKYFSGGVKLDLSSTDTHLQPVLAIVTGDIDLSGKEFSEDAASLIEVEVKAYQERISNFDSSTQNDKEIRANYNKSILRTVLGRWNTLEPQMKEVIERFGVESVVEMAKAAGPNAEYLFEFGFPVVFEVFDTPEKLARYWNGLVEIARVAGPNAGYLFDYGLREMTRHSYSIRDWLVYTRKMNKVLNFMNWEQVDRFFKLSVMPEAIKAVLGASQIKNRYDLIVLLLGLPITADERKEILDNFMVPYIFSHPEELTVGIMDVLFDLSRNDKDVRYLLYYISVSQRASSRIKRKAEKYISHKKLFKLHQAVAKGIKNGEKKVLIINNIIDGQGDELVRMGTLVQGLLDYNSALTVTIVTNRPYLYDNLRVYVVPISNVGGGGKEWDGLKKTYDVVIDHYEENESYSGEFEKSFLSSDVARQAYIYVRSNKSNDDFLFEKVRLGGQDYEEGLGLDRMKMDNVYEPAFRLAAEFGLPLRAAEDDRRTGSWINGLPYPFAESKWHDMMSAVGNKLVDGKYESPVVLFNPFGGESQGKGFSELNYELKEFVEATKKIVAKGYKVVLLPNGTSWGSRNMADALLKALPKNVRRSCVRSDEPSVDPRLFKYYVGYSDYVLTVEGGMMHLAYNMGKPFGMIRMRASGVKKWIPMAKSVSQGAIHGVIINVAEDVGRALSIFRNERQNLDSSMFVRRVDGSQKGGIDLTPERMDLQTTGSGGSIKFKIDPAQLEQLQSASGFSPVITNIQPMTITVPMFLGLKDNAPAGQLNMR